MKSAEYEFVVSQIAKGIFTAIEGQNPDEVKHGRRNKWKGASGFAHQIDVTVLGPRDLIFVECKAWGRRIKAEHVLTLAGRTIDVRQKLTGEILIHPMLVTTVGFQKGTNALAEFFGVRLFKVESATQFAIQFKQLWSLGLHDQMQQHDRAEVIVKPVSAN